MYLSHISVVHKRCHSCAEEDISGIISSINLRLVTSFAPFFCVAMRLLHQIAIFIYLCSISHSALCLPTLSSKLGLLPVRVTSVAKGLLWKEDDSKILKGREPQSLDDVPVPSSQVADETTMGPGNSTSANADPGFVTNDNTTIPEADCRNLKTGRDNKCWGELNLTAWVRKWMEANQDDCYFGEAFASCFTRLEGFYSLDCTGIKGDACSPPQDRDTFDENPELFYVMHNIYGTTASSNSLEIGS